ncbi:hypothetical protein H4Q26_000651 [Puccinia striiformis f. sp. tritici PST-130]|nr:hypothetical protein H4Q26_000651 [Puccinia striiformis f. sp. tritici PST-130]
MDCTDRAHTQHRSMVLRPRPSQIKPHYSSSQITEPLPPTIILNQPTKDHIIDPATQLEIPVELNPDHITLNESLRLVGSGVRTVSFLNVKVYVAGFYADPEYFEL